jgi:hypothetical protein
MNIKQLTEEEQLLKRYELIRSQLEDEVYVVCGNDVIPMAKFYLN